MTRARTIVSVVALAALLGATGCSDARTTQGQPTPEPAPEPEPVSEPHNGGRLVLAVGSVPGSLRPDRQVWDTSTLQVARGVFDRLAVYDETYRVAPELASSIDHNDDYTQWTITLRPEVVFHDGSTLDAEAVRANLEAQRLGPAGALLRPIQSVFVTGPDTVNVLMRSPWSTFPHVLTSQVGFVAAPSVLVEDPFAPIVGSGPFVVQAPTSVDTLRLTKNSSYWQDGSPRLDEIVVEVVPDAAARAEAVTEGTADVALVDDAPVVAELLDAGQVQVMLDPKGEAPKLTAVLNASRQPFLDTTARRAVGFATDRQALVSNGYGGVVKWVRGPVSDTSLWYNDPPILAPNTTNASEEATRYTEIYGEPLAFQVLVPTDPATLRFAALWQRQLAEAGIEAEMVLTEPDQVRQAAVAGEFDAVLLPMFGSWHPDLAYTSLHESEMTAGGVPGPNLARWGSVGLDQALDQARATEDLAEQVEQYRIMQNEIATGGAYLFLVRLPQAVVARNDVHDLTHWTTADGSKGLGIEEGTVSLFQVWLDRVDRPAE
jgi:peptide/nickel transport system substrate-binding protein